MLWEIILCPTKRTKNITLFGCRLYRRIYCVHCCCAGRVLKRCRDRIRRPRLKTKKVRIADRPEKIIWEPKRIDIYRGIGGVGACGAENILYSMCVCACVLYCTQYYIMYDVSTYLYRRFYIFTLFNAIAAGDEDTTTIIIIIIIQYENITTRYYAATVLVRVHTERSNKRFIILLLCSLYVTLDEIHPTVSGRLPGRTDKRRRGRTTNQRTVIISSEAHRALFMVHDHWAEDSAR